MTQPRRLTSSAFIIALVTTLLLPGPVLAADASEVESLRAEIRQLQAQILGLRNAVAEATELEGRRSANLARQMREPQGREPQGAAVAETLPPTPAAEPATGSREPRAVAASAAVDERPARAKHRRDRHTSRGRSKAAKAQKRN